MKMVPDLLVLKNDSEAVLVVHQLGTLSKGAMFKQTTVGSVAHGERINVL
jgi:hypothetical protein